MNPGDLLDRLDRVLVERLMRRDATALAAIYDRYGCAVYSLSLRILGDPSAAEDATHDVFLKLWRQPERYRPERGSMRAWLLSVAHNRAIDLLRRRRVASTRQIGEEPDWEQLSPVMGRDGAGAVGTVGGDYGTDPGLEAARVEEAARLRWALRQIPQAQREAIELAFFEGKTHVEISAELGEPLGTAKTRIRLGMRKLRALLEATESLPNVS
jgi:RNA polymerase sigma-70 factor (ECF subfamily)